VLRILTYTCVAVGCLGLTAVLASAQEVIHAMTGTISSIDAVHSMFTLFRDNGSQIRFTDMTGSNVPIIANDKKILSDATSARAFDKKDAYVIVFYFGLIDQPTAIAVEALGRGPFTSTDGTVESVNEGGRMISVEDKSGSIQRYKINADTVGESDLGVVEGLKLHAEKGEHLRIVGAASNNGPTALFVNEM
jgi:hypothetical protein